MHATSQAESTERVLPPPPLCHHFPDPFSLRIPTIQAFFDGSTPSLLFWATDRLDISRYTCDDPLHNPQPRVLRVRVMWWVVMVRDWCQVGRQLSPHACIVVLLMQTKERARTSRHHGIIWSHLPRSAPAHAWWSATNMCVRSTSNETRYSDTATPYCVVIRYVKSQRGGRRGGWVMNEARPLNVFQKRNIQVLQRFQVPKWRKIASGTLEQLQKKTDQENGRVERQVSMIFECIYWDSKLLKILRDASKKVKFFIHNLKRHSNSC